MMINTIEDLINLLQNYPKDTKVVGVDCVGEEHPVWAYMSNYKEDGLDIPEVLIIKSD